MYKILILLSLSAFVSADTHVYSGESIQDAIDNAIFISKKGFESIHPHTTIHPHYFWVTPDKPFNTYAILRSIKKTAELKAISPKLNKQTVVKTFKPIKQILYIVLIF